MPCAHFSTCPLFSYFSSHPILNLWRTHYCDKSDNSHCVRFQNTQANKTNPISLLPNGKQIELAPLTLFNAAKKNRTHLVANILANIDIDLDFQDINGETALMAAASEGHNKVVKFLLEKGANKDVKNYNNKTAFDIALTNHHENTASLLLPNN